MVNLRVRKLDDETLSRDRQELGLPISVPDGQIAAIARLKHFAVATRNGPDFENSGIEVINPFEFAA